MGLFRDVGRRAERLKQQVTDAAREEALLECADCGKSIFTDRTDCPDCGSEALLEVGGDDGDGASTEAEVDDGDGASTEAEADDET